MLTLFLGTVVCGCSAEAAHSDADWQGEALHLAVRGNLNGESVAVALEGVAGTDSTKLWCKREYESAADSKGEFDPVHAKQTEIEITAVVEVAGKPRILQLELKRHNLQADRIGSDIKIIPRVDGVEPPADSVWLDFEWTTLDDESILETSAQTGTVTLQHWSGVPGAGGVVVPAGEGKVGASIHAKWSEQEHLDISFTAPCTENETDIEN
jgi:hypothetical protein